MFGMYQKINFILNRCLIACHLNFYQIHFVTCVSSTCLDVLYVLCSTFCTDCCVYIAALAEFLSDQLVILLDYFRLDYLHNRYTSLLWRYDSDKVEDEYVSENDDPSKPKGQVTPPSEEDLVQIN